jgi:hypothetical protein
LFKVSRTFYRNYPQIRELLSFEEGFINGAMTSHELQIPGNEMVEKSAMPSHEFKTIIELKNDEFHHKYLSN